MNNSHFYSVVKKSNCAKVGVTILVYQRLIKFVKSLQTVNIYDKSNIEYQRPYIVELVTMYAPTDDTPQNNFEINW